MKLGGAAKAIIRNVVGDIHVATPDGDMLAEVVSRLNPDITPAGMKAVCIEALKQHWANYREYVAVMTGRF